MVGNIEPGRLVRDENVTLGQKLWVIIHCPGGDVDHVLPDHWHRSAADGTERAAVSRWRPPYWSLILLKEAVRSPTENPRL
jgi:hypothetical protein